MVCIEKFLSQAGFKKPNPVGFIGFFAVFLLQCAVLDAIHIKLVCKGK